MNAVRQVLAVFDRVVLIAVAVALLAALIPSPTGHAAATLAVQTDEAAAHFPDDITFSLRAEASTPIERVELLYAEAGQETLHLMTPDFVPGETVDLAARLDMRLNFLPPGLDLIYHWRLTDASGDVTETEPRTVLWLDDRFDWEEYRTDQVTVYAYNGDDDFNETILASAQQTIDKLQSEFAVERSRPLRLWIYDTKKDFEGSLAPNTEPWVGGISHLGSYLVLTTVRAGNDREIGRVIPHEVSHHVFYQATWNPFNGFNGPPTWLDEGLAVYVQDVGDEEFSALVADAADQGRLFSIRALNSAFPYDSADTTLAYAQSLSIVTFIIAEFGKDKLAALIDVYREGVSRDEALQRALGVTTEELDARWKASLGYAGDRAPSGGLTTRSPGDRSTPWSWTDLAPLLASGVPLMAFAAIVAIALGVSTIIRNRRGTVDSF